ncbi:hypothetical protein RHECNPAF_1360065 [Rhizobium etli CNPAF512]|nr:hypothetical protein RHECNPAF_1360065 [Rhizobium etli CNPAF512]
MHERVDCDFHFDLRIPDMIFLPRRRSFSAAAGRCRLCALSFVVPSAVTRPAANGSHDLQCKYRSGLRDPPWFPRRPSDR